MMIEVKHDAQGCFGNISLTSIIKNTLYCVCDDCKARFIWKNNRKMFVRIK